MIGDGSGVGAGGIELEGGVSLPLFSGVGGGVKFSKAMRTGVSVVGRYLDSCGGSITQLAQLLALLTIAANAWSIAKPISGVSFRASMKSFRGRK